MLVPNRAKQKLQSGGALLGVMLTLKDPSIAEILALSGMDYLCIDCEHTLFNEETIMHIAVSYTHLSTRESACESEWHGTRIRGYSIAS